MRKQTTPRDRPLVFVSGAETTENIRLLNMLPFLNSEGDQCQANFSQYVCAFLTQIWGSFISRVHRILPTFSNGQDIIYFAQFHGKP